MINYDMKTVLEKHNTYVKLVKYKFELMGRRSEISSDIHKYIAMGEHDLTHKKAIELKSVNYELDIVNNKIDEYNKTNEVRTNYNDYNERIL